MNSTHADHITSGSNLSYWIDSVKPLEFETLEKDLETDVLIIGGGISGLTTAYCLLTSGKRVIVVEDGFIASGETGRTTAHLTYALDDRYYTLEKLFGEEKMKLAAESHNSAITWIENTVKKENIDCDFKRIDGYLFLHPSDKFKNLEKELDATQRAGLPTTMVDSVPGITGEEGKAIRFPNQAQFHIIKYLNGLAQAIVSKGGKIFTRSHAVDITEKGAFVNGFNITSSFVVVATNSPVNDRVTMHTKQFAYRTYVIGGPVSKNSIQPALWWDTGDQESEWITAPYHYVRLQPLNEQYDLLIVGGEDHKTGQADKEDIPESARYERLIEWTRIKFPSMKEVTYRWSGQVLEPLDSLAFIGKNPGSKNIYIITGDSGNGMTHGTIGGILITDLINEKENRWADIYKPSRIPVKVAGKFVKEALNMAAQYADWLSKGDYDTIHDMSAGTGAIIASGAKKLAVYKDEDGEAHAYSAVCPHLGCVVQWNGEEKTFDCPCHGSRFSHEGKVINGPAITDLKKIEIPETA